MKELEIKPTIQVAQMDELTETERSLIELAVEATHRSYAPYSHFHVGAAILLKNGVTILGCNQENAAYPSGLCAERTAMFAASANYPGKDMRVLAIAAFTEGHFTEQPVSPCGGCRQVMVEFEDRQKEPMTIILYGTEGTYVVESAKELMPFCFVSESLKGVKNQ